ncbi:MAG: hypothetical protein KF681_04990 [Bdellovibrionaceae bacterium]|nr:hypothetical protein [Pseudobdellovibrionaceae bacterium]
MLRWLQLFLCVCLLAPHVRAEPACAKHAHWLNEVLSRKTQDPKCAPQFDQAANSLARGLRLCQELNADPQKRASCSPAVNQFLRLQEVSAHASREKAKDSASEVVSQYKGIVDGMDQQPNACLGQLSGLRRDLSCHLSTEFGQAPPERSWWSDFWNREQSEAPFSDIPPWAKMAVTTVASSVLWRYRGGGLFTDHNDSKSGERRLVTTLGYMGLGYFNGGLDGAITGGLMLPGLFVPYGEQMVMKDGVRGVDESGKWRNLAYMTGLGTLTTAAPSAYLYARGYNPTGMLLGGTAKGLCYFGSWNWAPNTFNSPNKEFVGGGPTQTAELCSGATIGLGMSHSLLYGKKKNDKPKPAPEKCDPNPR